MHELQPIRGTPSQEGSLGEVLYYHYQATVSILALYSKACSSSQSSPLKDFFSTLSELQNELLKQVELAYSLWEPRQKDPPFEDSSLKNICKECFQRYARIAICEKKSTLWIPVLEQIKLIKLCENTNLRTLAKLIKIQPKLEVSIQAVQSQGKARIMSVQLLLEKAQERSRTFKKSYAEPKPFL